MWAAFIAWPLLAKSCKEGKARATPVLPLEICYGIWQGSGGHRDPEPAQEHQASQKLLLPRLASITSLTVLCLLWLVFVLASLLGVDL